MRSRRPSAAVPEVTMHRRPRQQVRHGEREDTSDLARELRWAASQMHPVSFGFFPFGAQVRVFRHVRSVPRGRHRLVRRRHLGFRGGLFVLPLVLLLLLFFLASRGAGVVFLGFPFIFVLVPILFFRWVVRVQSEPVDEASDEGEELEDEPTSEEERYALPAEPLPAASVGDPREARLDAICDRILAAIEHGPATVRAFLTRPRKTIETLRRTGFDLLARERELREAITDEDRRRLDEEREQLARRIATEEDVVTRGRLQAALDALDDQREMYVAIRRNANRLDAEHTRLVYTLEGLYAQILRVRSAGTTRDPAQAEALRQTVASLRDEVGALADAIEEVERGPTPVALGRRAPADRPHV